MQHVEIRIRGHVDEQRSEWFEGLAITAEMPDESVLSGPVVDQTALFGLLTKIRNLGLTLLSVRISEFSPEDTVCKDKLASA